MAGDLIIIDHAELMHLFSLIRKAQGKLSQIKGGREISDDLDYAIKCMEIVCYYESDKRLTELMDDYGLTFVQEADEYKETKSKLDRIREILAE